MWRFVAQSAPTPDTWAQFGIAGAVVAVLGWVVYFLASQLRESRAAERASNDRILEVAERVLPAIADNTRVLSDVLRELERRRDR